MCTALIPKAESEYTAVLVDYCDGTYNLMHLSEESAKDYIVSDNDGNDVDKLVHIVK